MLVDSHSHFDVAEFDGDRAEALARARDAGVVAQIVPAISADGWDALGALCAREQGLFPAYGLHPVTLAQHRERHLAELAQRLQRGDAVAVGECGLDYFVEGLDAESQRHYFVRQLELARTFDLPVVLHARRAVDEVIATLRRIGGLRGVVHSFSGSAEQAQQLFKLGFALGIGGPVTYERASRLRGIVARMPIEHLLLETDSPDQPLASHRGARNEPAFLPEVAAVVAQLRDTDVAGIATATTRNAVSLFKLPIAIS